MRLTDVEEGTRVTAVSLNGNWLKGIVTQIDRPYFYITFDNLSNTIMEFTDREFNFNWKVEYEMSFPKVGKINKGTTLRLGKASGRTFVPGSISLFADGFKIIEDEFFVVGRNLNKGVYKELSINRFGKDWIIDK